MEEKAKTVEYVIPHADEEIYEEKYVVANKGKRFLAFLIDFALLLGIIYLMNIYVTSPYVYKPIWGYDQRMEEVKQQECNIAKEYNITDGTMKDGACVYFDAPTDENSEEYSEYYGNVILFSMDERNTDLEKQFSRFDTFTKIIDSTWAVLLVYVVPTLFFKNGRTIGKKIMKLLVIDSFGQPIKVFPYLFRELIGFWALEVATSFLLYFFPILIVGVVYICLSKKGRALHDVFFGTYVVNEKKEMRLITFDPEPVEEEEVEEETLKTVDGRDYY